jgi:hypothetical protein
VGASAEAALCIGGAAPSVIADGRVGDGGPAGGGGPGVCGTEVAGTAATGDGVDVAGVIGVRDSMAATGVVIGVGAARSAIVGPTTGAVFRFTAIRIRVWLSAGALDITAPLLSEEGCARQHVA